MANSNHHGRSESDPLLPPAEFTNTPPPQTHDGRIPADEDNRTAVQRLRIATPCLLTLFCLFLSDMLATVPVADIRETLICRKMYPDIMAVTTTTTTTTGKDPRCKDAAVQAELSLIKGWEITFALIPGILTGIPWGIAADKYGRTFVLQFANLGVLCSFIWQIVVYTFPDVFPIRMVWLEGLFFFAGGGVSTYIALLFTIASDIASEAQRSTSLLYLATAYTAATLLSGPIVYLAMERQSSWFALYLGLSLWLLVFPLTTLIPETRSEAAVQRAKKLAEEQGDGMGGGLGAHARWDLRPLAASIAAQTRMVFNTIFLRNVKLGVLLFGTLFVTLGRTADTLLLQYATKRFGWSWAEASFFYSFKGFISLGLTAIILPVVSQILLSKLKLAPVIKDWWLVLGSVSMLAIGSACIAVADSRVFFVVSLVLFQLGGGYEFAFRSMIAELVDPAHIAMLYSALGVFMTLSEVSAGPVLAALYRKGLEIGGKWLALPFFVSTIFIFITVVITFVVRLNTHQRAKMPVI